MTLMPRKLAGDERETLRLLVGTGATGVRFRTFAAMHG
jgi:hypothetical protein